MDVDISGPFRGSAAVAAGVLTRNHLRGPRFRRLFPDVYVPAHLEVDLELRAGAAYLLVAGRGIEYDGELHRTQKRARQDLEREAALTRLGWTILRFDAATVLGNPAAIVGSVRSGW